MIAKLLRSVLMLIVGLCFCMGMAWAQTGTIEGTITNEATGEPLVAANIYIPDLERGAATNVNGEFTLENIPYGTYQLRISYVGYQTETVSVTVDETIETIDVSLTPATGQLEELIVTGFGTSQTVNQLSYSAQNLEAEAITESGTADLMSSLSGKVAGLNVSSRSGMGGSTDIILRGVNSLTGNNQVLIVVDGVPMPNNRFNTADAEAGFRGFDFGSTALDISSQNIESITVLKGAAATALYGSRASAGAIIITTKQGAPAGETVDVTFNTAVGFSQVVAETFPTYQKQYGGGYVQGFFKLPNFWTAATSDTLNPVAIYTADASNGPKFDPSLGVYQWGAFYSGLPSYQQKTPWVAADHYPIEFFNTGTTVKNSLFIRGGINDGGGYYSLGYTQNNITGVMPNSNMDKYKLSFSGGYDVTEAFRVEASFDYAHTETIGRARRGYSTIMSSFRQWYQVNVDILEQKEAFFRNRLNTTWNIVASRDGPFYWNNPYWTRYENYETDMRDRYVGYAEAQYDVADWLSLNGRVSYTGYSMLIELRTAPGSVNIADYTRRSYNFSEYNYRLQARYNTQLNRSISLNGVVGFNARRTHRLGISASTSGGLVTPGVYSLDNSVNNVPFPSEQDVQLAVNGIYASANIGYNNYLYLRLTGRRDKASSLPEGNNTYFYPSVSGSFQFSDLIETDFLSFGKIRASWARVGATAPPLSLQDTYLRASNFQGQGSFTVPNTKNNPNLKPEITESWEVGLQFGFFNGRLFMDATYYNSSTFNQIFAVAISEATGYSFKYINAGEVANRGIGIMLRARPVITNDFSWQITVNWNNNHNEVVELTDELRYLELVAPQGGVSIGALEGDPVGVLRGSDFVYHNGQRVIQIKDLNPDPNVEYMVPVYAQSGPNEVIGNMNPDWTGGISNRFSYKNWSLNFLVDVRWGGSIFSLDQWYGQGTGLYPITAGLNERGEPKRAPRDEGGGVLLEGVVWQDTNGNGKMDETDTYKPNTRYTPYYVSGAATAFGFWGFRPQAAYVYDASYIKLREVGLTYNLPVETLQSIGINRASISVVGRDLWLIYDNLPHADPEASLTAGNLGGYSGGTLPMIRSFALNIELNF